MSKPSKNQAAKYLLLVGALVPPSALDVLGKYLDERVVETPYGDVGPLALRGLPSDDLAGGHCWIQPYSGLPTRTDPRATLFAARILGLSRVLSWDMGTALNPALALGQTVLAADYIDRTRHQPPTFRVYDEGNALPSDLVQQIQISAQKPIQLFDPIVTDFLQTQVVRRQRAIQRSILPVIYLGLDGPRRETPAEARIYRQWGADVLGYNLIPEVFLAHELGLSYTGFVTIRNYSAEQNSAQMAQPAAHSISMGIEQMLQIFALLLQAQM